MKDMIDTGGFVRRSAMFALVTAAVLARADKSHAQPTVRAYLDRPEIVGSGQPIELILEFSGVDDRESIGVPVGVGSGEFEGFPRRGVLIRAGGIGMPRSGDVFTVRYVFMGDVSPGSYRIGPLRVTADGRTLETEPLTLLVAGSEETTVRARVDPPEVKVGDNFELIVEVLGGERMTHFPEIPHVFDFAEHEGGSGGSDDSYSFTMLATTPGEFAIPSIPVRFGNRVLETEPVELVITDEPVDVDVQARILSRSIWVGGEFVVSLQVEGVRELDEEPVFPAMGPFAERVEPNRAQQRTGFRTFAGRRAMARNFTFRALDAGSFEIGPVQVIADGRTFMTDPVGLVVTELPVGGAEPPDNFSFMAMPEGGRAARGIYVGEPVFLSYAIHHRQRRLAPLAGTVSWPSFDDFQLVELSGYWSGQDVRTTVDGRPHNVLTVQRVALLPVADGDLVIGPAAVEVQVESERPFRSRRAEWPARTSFVLSSDPVALEVLPLPEAGRPESFRGHVGTLEVTSWVNRTGMQPGDTLTLRIEVDIDGYMGGLPDPEIEFPDGLVMMPPRIRNAMHQDSDGLSGVRTYIHRLVAVAEGTHEIPAVVMSYFDPETEGYGVSRGRPFTITVVPAGEEARQG